MAVALIGQAAFVADAAGAPGYAGSVLFALGAGARFLESTFLVSLGAGDSLATLQTKVLAAVDAEAVRLGLAAPTAVYGGAVSKLR